MRTRTNCIRVLVASCLTILCGSLQAAESWHTSTLLFVYPLSDGSFVLTFTVDAADCPAVVSPKYHYVSVNQNGVTDEGARKMYAAALTALAADKTVQVNFDNATSACYVNRLAVLR